jgi:transposase InsO family protein
VSEITYIGLREECVYLAVLMDVFTRCIRGWHLGRNLDQSLTLRALEQALTHHTPEIHHSDQVVQYAATAYTARLQAIGTQISMAGVGAAWQNGYAERLMRTIKEEEVDDFLQQFALTWLHDLLTSAGDPKTAPYHQAAEKDAQSPARLVEQTPFVHASDH